MYLFQSSAVSEYCRSKSAFLPVIHLLLHHRILTFQTRHSVASQLPFGHFEVERKSWNSPSISELWQVLVPESSLASVCLPRRQYRHLRRLSETQGTHCENFLSRTMENNAVCQSMRGLIAAERIWSGCETERWNNVRVDIENMVDGDLRFIGRAEPLVSGLSLYVVAKMDDRGVFRFSVIRRAMQHHLRQTSISYVERESWRLAAAVMQIYRISYRPPLS